MVTTPRLIDEKIPIRSLCSMEYVVVIGPNIRKDFFELGTVGSRNSLTHDSVIAMRQQQRQRGGSLES